MKKKKFLTSILILYNIIFSSTYIYALQFENIVEPLYNIHFKNTNTGWIWGNGCSYKTTNGGINWGFPLINSSPLADYVSGKFFFTDSINGWAVNGSENIIKTTNGGNLWQTVSVYPEELTDIYFVNISTGWVIANENNSPYPTILKTTNSGITWFTQLIPGYENKPKLSIFMNDYNNGWIGMDSGIVANTTDGGNSWTLYNLSSSVKASLIYFVNRNNGWIWSNPGHILRTTNSGANWNPYTMPYSNDNVNQTWFTDSIHGFAMTNNRLLKTTNGGINWIMIPGTNTSGTLESIYFNNSNTGWMPTASGNILETTNGGNNWFSENNPFLDDFNSVFFINNNTGWIVTQNGFILKTTNTGINWSTVNSPTTGILKSIFFINEITGWISESGGAILKTSNSGYNWNAVQVPNLPNNGMSFTDENHGWLVGNNGSVFYTIDGAANWTSLNPFTSNNLSSVHFVDSYTGFVCGGNSVFKTTNAGSNWTSVNPTTEDSYSAINFLDYNTGFVTAYYIYYTGWIPNQRRRIYKTYNGGITWNAVYDAVIANNIPIPFKSIFLSNQNTACVTTDNSEIYISENSGNSWVGNVAPALNGIQYNNSFMFDINSIWVVGSNSAIVVSDLPVIGLHNISKVIPVSIVLNQNYPNPFNPSTKIKFDLPTLGNGRDRSVRMIIYDILGREVATLINEQLKPGSYEVEWDGSNYASGIYFYSLQTSEYTQNKKMILIK